MQILMISQIFRWYLREGLVHDGQHFSDQRFRAPVLADRRIMITLSRSPAPDVPMATKSRHTTTFLGP